MAGTNGTFFNMQDPAVAAWLKQQGANQKPADSFDSSKYVPSGFDKTMGNMMGGFERAGEWLTGKPARVTQNSLMSPQQQRWIDETLRRDMNTPEAKFDPIEQFVRQNFSKTTMPSLMSRISRLNGMQTGAGRQMMADTQTGLETQLGAMRSDWERGNRQDMAQRVRMAMQPTFENTTEPAQKGNLLPLIMAGISAYTGGGSGMALSAITELLKGLMEQQGQGQEQENNRFGGSFSIPEQQINKWNRMGNMPNYLSALGPQYGNF